MSALDRTVAGMRCLFLVATSSLDTLGSKQLAVSRRDHPLSVTLETLCPGSSQIIRLGNDSSSIARPRAARAISSAAIAFARSTARHGFEYTGTARGAVGRSVSLIIGRRFIGHNLSAHKTKRVEAFLSVSVLLPDSRRGSSPGCAWQRIRAHRPGSWDPYVRRVLP